MLSSHIIISYYRNADDDFGVSNEEIILTGILHWCGVILSCARGTRPLSVTDHNVCVCEGVGGRLIYHLRCELFDRKTKKIEIITTLSSNFRGVAAHTRRRDEPARANGFRCKLHSPTSVPIVYTCILYSPTIHTYIYTDTIYHILHSLPLCRVVFCTRRVLSRHPIFVVFYFLSKPQ